MGQRVRPQLEVHDQRAGQGLARRARTGRVDALDVRRGAVAGGHPQSFAFPAGIRIVDAAIHALGEEAHGIGDAQFNDLAIGQGVQRIREITGTDGGVRAQAQDVVLVHPGIIGRLGGTVPAGERGSWDGIERPAFGAQVALRRSWPVQGSLALAPVEASHVATRQRHPRHALAVDVHAAHAKAGLWDLVDLYQRGLRRIWSRIQPQDVPGVTNVRAPDGTVRRAIGDGVEAQPDTLVLTGLFRLIGLHIGVALAVAAGVDDEGRPALCLASVTGLPEQLGVDPANDG